MKHLLQSLFFILLFNTATAAPFAVFNYKIFYLPGEGPVVETYLDFHGKSITMRPNEDGKLEGLVEVTIVFRKGDDIVTYDKKVLNTPAMPVGGVDDFIDMQRFRIAEGDYQLELRIEDLNDAGGTAVEQTIDITVDAARASMPYFSDVLLVLAYKKAGEHGLFTRSGYDLLPMVSDDYVGSNVNELMYYAELYNTSLLGKDEKFLLSSYIRPAGSQDPIPDTQRFERKNTNQVTPVMSKIDISELGSGDYDLVLEVRDRENNVISNVSHAFTRNFKGKAIDMSKIDNEFLSRTWVNLYSDKGELYTYVQSTRPIADEAERYSLESSLRDMYAVEIDQLRNFFYQFWENRQPNDGENAWLAYKEKVDFVETEFGTRNKHGFETDRGRVYLQYGAPIDVVDRANEPSTYPYQIWRYYKAGRWNNVRFVFFDPELTGRDYTLLHCERIPGEIINPQWRVLLEQRSNPQIDVDRRNVQQNWGGRVEDFFDNPR